MIPEGNQRSIYTDSNGYGAEPSTSNAWYQEQRILSIERRPILLEIIFLLERLSSSVYGEVSIWALVPNTIRRRCRRPT